MVERASVAASRTRVRSSLGVPFGIADSWVVYDQGPAMFPGLARTSDGDLLLTFSTVADGLAGGRVMTIRSQDDGRTWGLPRVVVQGSSPDWGVLNAIGLTTLSDGWMLLPYNEVKLHGGYEKRSVSLFLLRSKDGGHTWTERLQVAQDFYEPCQYGQILECPDGALLWPVWGRLRVGERWRSGLLRSYDGGNFWENFRTVAYDPHARILSDYRFSEVSGFDASGKFDSTSLNHERFRPHSTVDGFSEASFSLLSDGRILAVLRQQGVGGSDRLDLYFSLSGDQGDTWTPYNPTGRCGMSPVLHRTSHGQLILAFRRRVFEGSEEVTPGVALTWSEDNGESWTGEMVLRDPWGYRLTEEYQAGYPSLINLRGDHVLVVFYSYSPRLPHRRYLAANLLQEN